jgi:hypothetical protein
MLSSDGQGHLYGAYASPAQACEAAERCGRFECVWQYDPRTQATQLQRVNVRRAPLGRVDYSFDAPRALNICIVQRASIGEDDKVEDVWCPTPHVQELDDVR